MTIPVPPLTPYADVNAILHDVLSGAQSVLGEDFLDMYLSESLAAGDFDPQQGEVSSIPLFNPLTTAGAGV